MNSPLNFIVHLFPSSPQSSPDILQCGESFNSKVVITTNGKSFSYKSVTFSFGTFMIPHDGKPRPLCKQVTEQISDSGKISDRAEFDLPTVTIPENIKTYHGGLFSVKHIITIQLKKKLGGIIEHSKEVVAYTFDPCELVLQPINVRVSVTDSMAIQIVVNRRTFDLGDVIMCGIHFLLMSLKIMKFECNLIVNEIIEVGGKPVKNVRIIKSWQVTDGAPIKGEIIPFRIFLKPLDLTPYCMNRVAGYSASYFLNFVFYTAIGRKYFKNIQIRISKWDELPFVMTE